MAGWRAGRHEEGSGVGLLVLMKSAGGDQELIAAAVGLESAAAGTVISKDGFFEQGWVLYL